MVIKNNRRAAADGVPRSGQRAQIDRVRIQRAVQGPPDLGQDVGEGFQRGRGLGHAGGQGAPLPGELRQARAGRAGRAHRAAKLLKLIATSTSLTATILVKNMIAYVMTKKTTAFGQASNNAMLSLN